EKFSGFTDTNKPRQKISAFGSQAQVHKRLIKTGRLRRNPQVTSQSEIHPLTACHSLNRGNYRLRNGSQLHLEQVNAFDPVAHKGVGILIENVLHHLDVAARTESASLTTKNHDTDFTIIRAAEDSPQHLVEHLEVDGIEILRAIHGERGNSTLDGEADRPGIHVL